MFPTFAMLLNSEAIVPFLGSLLVSLAFAVYLRRLRRKEWRVVVVDVLGLLSIVGILAITLFRNVGSLSFSDKISWAPAGLERFIGGLGNDGEISLNVMLFIPAGLVLTLRRRRPWAVAFLLAALSFGIELIQGISGLGNADLSDLLSNALGAVLGVFIACSALCFTQYRNTELIWSEVVMVGAILLAVAGTFPLADWRQEHFERDLRGKFAGTTLADYGRWDQRGELAEKVFRLDDIFSDGESANPDHVDVRFPTDTLGVRQCVWATWTSSSFRVWAESGSPCQTFLG